MKQDGAVSRRAEYWRYVMREPHVLWAKTEVLRLRRLIATRTPRSWEYSFPIWATGLGILQHRLEDGVRKVWKSLYTPKVAHIFPTHDPLHDLATVVAPTY